MPVKAVDNVSSAVVDVTTRPSLGAGTVTSIAGGNGLTPGPITTTGTIGLVGLTSPWNAGNQPINSQNSTGWFNVVAYGADPTGVADSTTAFANAIAAAVAGSVKGGVVYVPPGFYTLSSTLTVPSGITFQGDGQEGDLGNYGSILALNTTTDGFNITGTAGTPVQFRDLYITTIGAVAATAGSFIHANAAANFPLYVINCKFTFHKVALLLNSTWLSSVISGCNFSSGTAGGIDITVDNLVNVDQGGARILNNTFLSNGFYNIRQRAGGGTWVYGNSFIGAAQFSVYLDIPAGKTTSDLLIHSNNMEGNVVQANIGIVPSGTFSNVLIQNNEFEATAAGGQAILVAPTATGFTMRGQITGNTFYNGANYVVFGPLQAGGADKWRVDNNIFDSATVATITLPGTAANLTNLKIGRNTVIQSGTAPYVSGVFSSSSGFDPGIETVFTQTANSTTTANTASTVFGAGSGSLTIQAGRLMVGTQIRVKVRGFISVADGGAAAHIIVLKLGGVTVATGTTAAITNTLNTPFNFDATITCRTTGAGGTVIGNYTASFWNVLNFFAVPSTATSAANTPTALAVDVTLNNGNATGTMTTTEASLELLN